LADVHLGSTRRSAAGGGRERARVVRSRPARRGEHVRIVGGSRALGFRALRLAVGGIARGSTAGRPLARPSRRSACGRGGSDALRSGRGALPRRRNGPRLLRAAASRRGAAAAVRRLQGQGGAAGRLAARARDRRVARTR
jgi:hypothetical protein